MSNDEKNSENHVKLFEKKMGELIKQDLGVLTYSEFTTLRTEKYLKGEKNGKNE